jgi:hypothetical protein
VAFREATCKVEGLKKTHDDNTPLIAVAVPPLEQPPKVQTLATTK